MSPVKTTVAPTVGFSRNTPNGILLHPANLPATMSLMRSDEPPSTLTDRVVLLRPLHPDDAADHVRGEDDASRRWLNEGHVSTVEGTRRWIEHSARMWAGGGPRLVFGVRDAATETLIGMVEANTDWRSLGLQPGEANLSYQVYPVARRRGVATRAVRLLIAYLDEAADVHTAVIRTEPANAASTAVATRLGFQLQPDRPDKDELMVYTYRL